MDLFGDVVSNDTETNVYADYANLRPWSIKQRLQGEKETLGLYVTGHPIEEYETELRQFVANRIVDLKADNHSQKIAGLVVNMRMMKNKRGDNMAFVQLDDRSARIEVSLFSDVFEQCREKIVKDSVLVIEGKVSFDDYTGNLKMRGNAVHNLLEARQNHARELIVNLQESDFSNGFMSEFKKLLRSDSAGVCPVVIQYQNSEAKGQLRLGAEWKIQPSDELIQRLRDRIGTTRVSLHYGD